MAEAFVVYWSEAGGGDAAAELHDLHPQLIALAEQGARAPPLRCPSRCTRPSWAPLARSCCRPFLEGGKCRETWRTVLTKRTGSIVHGVPHRMYGESPTT